MSEKSVIFMGNKEESMVIRFIHHPFTNLSLLFLTQIFSSSIFKFFILLIDVAMVTFRYFWNGLNESEEIFRDLLGLG